MFVFSLCSLTHMIGILCILKKNKTEDMRVCVKENKKRKKVHPILIIIIKNLL